MELQGQGLSVLFFVLLLFDWGLEQDALVGSVLLVEAQEFLLFGLEALALLLHLLTQVLDLPVEDVQLPNFGDFLVHDVAFTLGSLLDLLQMLDFLLLIDYALVELVESNLILPLYNLQELQRIGAGPFGLNLLPQPLKLLKLVPEQLGLHLFEGGHHKLLLRYYLLRQAVHFLIHPLIEVLNLTNQGVIMLLHGLQVLPLLLQTLPVKLLLVALDLLLPHQQFLVVAHLIGLTALHIFYIHSWIIIKLCPSITFKSNLYSIFSTKDRKSSLITRCPSVCPMLPRIFTSRRAPF